jgi:hypothetical protein
MYGYSDKTTLSYAAIFNIKKGLHLRTEEYVSYKPSRRTWKLMLGHKELALILVLFWVGWMGLTDKSVDAKVSIGKVPGGERKSF